jgi:hypothetical protein
VKISSNLKSFEIAVIVAMLEFKSIELKGFLFFRYFPNNSADKCKASAAEPPFPQKIIFLSTFNVLIIISEALLIKSMYFFFFNLLKFFYISLSFLIIFFSNIITIFFQLYL